MGHSNETGLAFEEEALSSVRNLTQGQPWPVNALAYEVCFTIEEGKIRSDPMTGTLCHGGTRQAYPEE